MCPAGRTRLRVKHNYEKKAAGSNGSPVCRLGSACYTLPPMPQPSRGMSDLVFLSAAELTESIRRKQVSPVEVVEAHLAQIDRLNPQLNAIVSLDREGALAAARRAEAAVIRGDGLGPLHGAPVTIKSSIDAAGLRCEAGTKLRAGYVPTGDILKEFIEVVAAEPPLTLERLLHTWLERDQCRTRLLMQMRQFPVLLCPVCSIPAFRHGERAWNVDGQSVAYLDAMRYAQWVNLTGNPAAVVPAGRSPEGLPIGVQIVGRPHEEEVILAIAEKIESALGGWQRPPSAAASIDSRRSDAHLGR